jgi:hypothetical protein
MGSTGGRDLSLMHEYTSSASPKSRVIGPALSRVLAIGMISSEDKDPWAGLSPVTPSSVTQPTIENDVSVPIAAEQNPADMATAEPELDPLGPLLRP